MTSLVILLLVVLWGAVFGPTLLRARTSASPYASVGSFRRGMRALSGGRDRSGRWVLIPQPPRDPEATAKRVLFRRRRLFVGLIAIAVLTLAIGAIPKMHAVLFVHIAADLALGAFVAWLIQIKKPAPKHAVRPKPEPAEDSYLEAGSL